MARILTFTYGVAAYVLFLVASLYSVGFVAGVFVPKTIDSGPVAPIAEAVIVNLLLLSLFGIQHSGMARKEFKAWWNLPVALERSTYVLIATLFLALLMWQWRPIPIVLWHVINPWVADAVVGLAIFGWVLVFFSTFLINHFEFVGLQQVFFNLLGRRQPEPEFRTPLLYKVVRHPLYFGFIIAFWATPTMTVGHLMFAAMMTGYIFIGIWFEERDLVAVFGEEYRRYRRRVAMLVPFGRGSGEPHVREIDRIKARLALTGSTRHHGNPARRGLV
jgi:protein-S-isoprenylcysteine O-methyltransferase Ste14